MQATLDGMFRETGYENVYFPLFISAHWCGSVDCEAGIQEEVRATIRCVPFDREDERGRCIFCEAPSEGRVLFARAY